MRTLIWDIETSPIKAYIWQAKTDFVTHDKIIQDWFMLTWAAKWEDDEQVHYGRLTKAEAEAKDDSRIVKKLARLVESADVLVAHNGDRFDLPKLRTRMLVHGMKPLPPVATVDTLKQARSTFGFFSNRLDYLAKTLGNPGKHHTDFQLWVDAMHGDTSSLKRMDEYCRNDVVELERVYKTLKPHIKLPRMVESTGVKCTACGSDDLQRRGYHRSKVATYQRFQCKGCGSWCRSRKSLEGKLSTT